MANTYTQLYVHVVFAVSGRKNLVLKEWKDELYQYITGIVRNKKQKLMIINGMPDHLHILLGLRPDCNLSELVRDIKANSSKWISENGKVTGKFQWQNGFGAFSVGHFHVQRVINYIKNQEEHHRKSTFREEYIGFLQSNEIDYKPEFLFEETGDWMPETD